MSPERGTGDDRGFTLVESLVALVILGIAAVGIIGAVEAHVDRLRMLEERAAAQWVAENAMTEARLGIGGGAEVARPMLGSDWSVSTQLAPSDDPDLSLATVAVRAPGEDRPLVTLRGFVDTGRVTP